MCRGSPIATFHYPGEKSCYQCPMHSHVLLTCLTEIPWNSTCRPAPFSKFHLGLAENRGPPPLHPQIAHCFHSYTSRKCGVVNHQRSFHAIHIARCWGYPPSQTKPPVLYGGFREWGYQKWRVYKRKSN